MSKQQSSQKRQTASVPTQKPTPAPARSTAKNTAKPKFNWGDNSLIFEKTNFIWMGIGLALILLGLVLMSGGAQPDPTQWDESLIYSPRRITLAPILMVAGFIVEIYAIFKRPAATETGADA